jgi:hypothetical protein
MGRKELMRGGRRSYGAGGAADPSNTHCFERLLTRPLISKETSSPLYPLLFAFEVILSLLALSRMTVLR